MNHGRLLLTRLISAMSTLIRLQSTANLTLDSSAPSWFERSRSFLIAEAPESDTRSSTNCSTKTPGLLLRTSSMCALCPGSVPLLESACVGAIRARLSVARTYRKPWETTWLHNRQLHILYVLSSVPSIREALVEDPSYCRRHRRPYLHSVSIMVTVHVDFWRGKKCGGLLHLHRKGAWFFVQSVLSL